MELGILHTKRRRSQPRTLKINCFQAQNDEICPISQDFINESSLEFLENNHLLEDKPSYKGIVLDCNHKFNGIFLIYNWARNKNILCPVCRGGLEGAYLNLKQLPKHIGNGFARKVRSERRRDNNQIRLENEAVARRLQNEENFSWLMHFIPENVVFVVQPRHENNFIIIQCDAQILSDGMCNLTSTIPASVLANMGEYRFFVSIRSKSRSNSNMEIQTRLPESAWFTYEYGSGPRLYFCNEAPFCQYSMMFDMSHENVILKLLTPFSFLKFVSDSHLERVEDS